MNGSNRFCGQISLHNFIGSIIKQFILIPFLSKIKFKKIIFTGNTEHSSLIRRYFCQNIINKNWKRGKEIWILTGWMRLKQLKLFKRYIDVYICIYPYIFCIYASLQKSKFTLPMSKYILLYNHYNNSVHSQPKCFDRLSGGYWT